MALGIQHAMLCSIFIQGMIFEKKEKVLKVKCVFLFSLQC